MACRRAEVGVSRVVVQCGGVAGVLEGCLGPHGRAVLMEKAGCVLITQDGSELLSTLEICDPLVNHVVRATVEQTKVLGDGCKITILLLRHLLSSLDATIPCSSVTQVARRQKLIQLTQYLRKNILWRIQRDVINYGAQVYPLRSFEAITHILHSTAEDLFRTKFSKFVAKNLAKLFSSYISSECSSSGELLKLLDYLAVHTHSAIIEVFHMPLIRSHVLSGFVITRRFRHLHKNMKFDNVPFILWSIELEEKRDGQPKDIVETKCGETLVESIVGSRNRLERCLALLVSLGTRVILSSLCFPDWGMSMCIKYGISLIDGIDSEEWKLLDGRLRIQPVTCEDDVLPGSIGNLERIEPIRIGTCDYVRLNSQGGHQMILCGPTATQCQQFSRAYVKLFKYLSSWVADCLDFYHNNSATEPKSPEINRENEHNHHAGFKNSNNTDVCSYSSETLDSYHDGLTARYNTDGNDESDEYFGWMNSNRASECVGNTENHMYHDKVSVRPKDLEYTHNWTAKPGRHTHSVPSDGARASEHLGSGQKFNCNGSTTSHTPTEQTNIWHCSYMLNRCLGPANIHSARASDYLGPSSTTSYSQSTSYYQSAPSDPRVGAVLYAVPHGGFVELLAKYLVTENMPVGKMDDTTRLILLSLLNEIPWQLHRKVRYSRKSYLEFQTKLFNQFGDLKRGGQKFIQPQVMQGSYFTGYQSPFLLFKILDCVLHFAEYILRIECIIPSKVRISTFMQTSKDDDSDDD